MACCLPVLTACGGGGGGGNSGSTPSSTAVPASGAYSWVLKAEGPTASLKYGLSLVHPGASSTEWVIEAANAAISDAKVLTKGSVNGPTQSVSALQPYALIYIVGGDVRRVPLQANGTAPKTQVQKAGSTSACRFLIEAVDHATPELSRYIVSTAGADGLCGRTDGDATDAEKAQAQDNGFAEVRLSAASPTIQLTPLTGAAPLGLLRDPTTLVPRGWLYPTAAVFWTPNAGETVTVRAAANPITRLVGSTYRTALVETVTGTGADTVATLSLLDFSGGTAYTETAVNISAAGGWQHIGHDSQYHYAYRNIGSETGSWQVIRVSRSSPVATVMGGGSGAVAVASLGRDYLYVTALGTSTNQLLRLNKNVPGANVQSLDSTPRTTLSTVVTSSLDVHQLWRVTGVGTSSPAYTLTFFDEAGSTGNTLFTSTGGGFPMLLAGGSTLNFNASENRSVFVIADRYGTRAFGDAALVSYDAQSRSAKTLGTLPGSADFGADTVFANVSGSYTTAMAGYAARSVSGVVQGAGTKVYGFDAGTVSSLKLTSQQQ